MSAPEFRRTLEAAAREHGFDCVGIARPDAIPDARERFETFIAAGAHGDMDWLATSANAGAIRARCGATCAR